MRKLAILMLLSSASAHAGGVCRAVDVVFKPVPNLQIAAWIEDDKGNYVDTAYVTRMTGVLGLANRPGNHLFKSDFHFPYGRRDMVLPVWAHARNHKYGYVVMGGRYGNSIPSCQANGTSGSDCDDETIGYHFSVSSPEPFYCSPRGGVVTQVNGVDVVSCASAFYGSKGAYADSPLFSYYPPRADLTSFVDDHDGIDAKNYSNVNDLVAISGATPAGNSVIDPPIHWSPPADGKYVLKVEAGLEFDVNSAHNHAPVDDEHPELNGYGCPASATSYCHGSASPFGQPSIVYAVPFTVGDALDIETSSSYAGYGDWDGATGTMHAADSTISDTPGSGAGRFLDVTDDQGTWRIKVTARPDCDMVTPTDGGMPMDGGGPVCVPPDPPQGLTLTPHSTEVDVAFASASTGTPTARFDIRYSYGELTDANFATGIPATNVPPPGAAGSSVSAMLTDLKPEQRYSVAVRAIASCGAVSHAVVATTTTTKAQFVTLHGCFIATAAYGTPMAKEIDVLRRFRDQKLLTTPLGQLAVAAYYSLSPPIAAALTTDERLRAGARALVDPIVRVTRAAERAQARALR
jgi:hypothetical protein